WVASRRIASGWVATAGGERDVRVADGIVEPHRGEQVGGAAGGHRERVGTHGVAGTRKERYDLRHRRRGRILRTGGRRRVHWLVQLALGGLHARGGLHRHVGDAVSASRTDRRGAV